MMFTEDENAELDSLAVELAYNSILLSGLYQDLKNDQWDALAKELAGEVREVINRRIQERIDRIAEAA